MPIQKRNATRSYRAIVTCQLCDSHREPTMWQRAHSVATIEQKPLQSLNFLLQLHLTCFFLFLFLILFIWHTRIYLWVYSFLYVMFSFVFCFCCCWMEYNCKKYEIDFIIIGQMFTIFCCFLRLKQSLWKKTFSFLLNAYGLLILHNGLECGC